MTIPGVYCLKSGPYTWMKQGHLILSPRYPGINLREVHVPIQLGTLWRHWLHYWADRRFLKGSTTWASVGVHEASDSSPQLTPK